MSGNIANKNQATDLATTVSTDLEQQIDQMEMALEKLQKQCSDNPELTGILTEAGKIGLGLRQARDLAGSLLEIEKVINGI